MKSLVLAIATAAVLVSPAFADSDKHVFTIGQRVPAAFVSSKFACPHPEEFGLSKPDLDRRWIIVDDMAYLIDTRNDTVQTLTPVKK